MTKFRFCDYSFGDPHPEYYGKYVWVVAHIDDTRRGIGAYIYRDGRVIFNDHVAWCVENDLQDAGIEPGGKIAEALLDEWRIAAREQGMRLF